MHAALEDAPSGPAAPLGVVHRDVGVADQVARAHRASCGWWRCRRSRPRDARRRPARGPRAKRGSARRPRRRPRDRRGGRAGSRTRRRRSARRCRSGARTAQPLGDGDEQVVADRVAERVVDGLEVVDVDEQHGDRRLGQRERLLDAVDEQRAVREAGERVVVGLVLELALELAQLPHRLLEAVVLERDRGVGGERLEQPQVGVGERAHDAGAVCEQHRADHARLPRQHREHRVGDPAVLEVALQPEAARLGRDARDRGVVVDQRAQLVGDRGVDRLHDVAGVAGPVRGAQRRVGLGREQDDLGDLGAERLQRAVEQPLERDDDLGRARQRARRLVEELEALVALALGGVGAIGEEDGDERDDEQRAARAGRRRRSRRPRGRGSRSSW